MPDYDLIKKEQKRTEQQQESRQSHLANSTQTPVQTDNTVIGRSSLVMPIPVEAEEKSVTKGIKRFFGIKQEVQRPAKGDYYDAYKQEDINRTSAVVDLSEEERETVSSAKNDAEWTDIHEMALEVSNRPDFEKLPEFTKTIVRDIEIVSRKNTERDYSEQYSKRIMKGLNEIREEYAVFHKLKKESEKKDCKEYLEEKYGDPEMLFTFAAILTKKTIGDLEINPEDEVLDRTDDSFFETGSKKIAATADDYGNVFSKRKVVMKKDCSDVPLFIHEPSTKDVSQGDIGDCYMLAGLNSILEHDPALIKGAMRDEGKTVVVRFYSAITGAPFYVRVSKVIPEWEYKGKNPQGEDMTTTREYGSTGAFWVKIMEKAYASVRKRQIWNDILGSSHIAFSKGYDILKGGMAERFIEFLTGKKSKRTFLEGANYRYLGRKTVGLEYLFTTVHYSEKTAFMREKKEDGSARTAKDWNIFKAKQMFGLDITEKDGALYELFRKNKIFDVYENYMRKHLKANFKSVGIFSNAPTFFSVSDLNLFLDSIKTKDMPSLNLGKDIDEERVKRNYIEYFRASVIGSGILKNTVNTDGKYTETETRVFEDLRRATSVKDGEKKLVTASTGVFTLNFRKRSAISGQCGEAIVNGVGSQHAYSVLGTKEKTMLINGIPVKQLFVVVHNPWNNYFARFYDRHMQQRSDSDILRKDVHHNARGSFLMELRDFCETFSDYSIG